MYVQLSSLFLKKIEIIHKIISTLKSIYFFLLKIDRNLTKKLGNVIIRILIISPLVKGMNSYEEICISFFKFS